nr:MAG TPA: intron associated endonuclease [Caudoviricetes sp.]
MKTIVYLTINTENNKLYIGIHDVNDELMDPFGWDNYYGCGVNRNYPTTIKYPKTPFQHAIKKYGFDAFKRYTLAVCDTREEALEIERILVNEQFISRLDTYNITLGGDAPPINKKEIYQYSTSGDYIQSFQSIREASIETNISEQGIGRSVLYNTLAGNYYWSEDKLDKIDVSKFTKPQNKNVYIYTYSGEFYLEFNSLSETARYFDTCLSVIQKAIKKGTKVHNYYISDTKYNIYPIKSKRKRKINSVVYQYDSNGKYLTEFKSTSEACKICGFKSNKISSAIADKCLFGDFYWSWDKVDQLNVNSAKTRKRKVGRYDEEGNLLEVFNSVRECRETYSNINKVLKGICTTCKGYRFKYIDD